jgi:SNF2 family DNA or RNA helicase
MTHLFEHQRKAVEQFREQKAFALYWEMGSGKTATALSIAEWRLQNGFCKHVIVFTPLAVVSHWLREVKRFTPSLTAEAAIGARQEKILGFLKPADIHITSYDTMTHLPGMLKIIHEDTFVILDEVTRIKRKDSKRSKTARDMRHLTNQICSLTGTPITNTFFDAWMLNYMMDMGMSLGTDFTDFKHFYFRTLDKFGWTWVPKPGTPENLRRALAKYGTFVLKKDCLDLPEKTYRTIPVTMDVYTRQKYDEFKETCLLLLGNDRVEGQTVLTELIKAHEIANGFVISSGTRNVVELPSAKMVALLDLIENELWGQQVIIWCSYTALLERITKEISEKYKDLRVRTLYSQTSRDDRARLEEDWQQHKFDILVANQEVGGYGLNLTPCSVAIYFTNNFRVETRVQSEDRVHRPGAVADKITIIDLVVNDSVDALVYSQLKRKVDVAATVMNAQDMFNAKVEDADDQS